MATGSVPGRWWLDETIRLVQTNLRETDAGLDPAQLVSEVQEFGANTLLFSAGGIVAWYPTRVPYHQVNPYLKGDLLGAVVEAAHGAGLRILARLDLSKCPQPALDERPQWFYLSPAGERVHYNGQYHTCINGGYYREQGVAILREVLETYPVDGVFFNMFGFQKADYSGTHYGICHCDGCRECFREETRMGLPASEAPGTAGLEQHKRFCERKTRETARLMRSVTREFGDHIALSTWLMDPAVDIIRMESNRSLQVACPPFHHLHSAWAVNRVRTSCHDQTLCCATNHFLDIPYRFASEPAGLNAVRTAGCLAAGGNLDFYVLGALDQPDREDFAAVGDVFRFQRDHAERYRELRSTAPVLLVEDSPHSEAMRGFYLALSQLHLQFDVLAAGQLDRWAEEERLRRYAVAVLPDHPGLRRATAAAIGQYVAGGGRILAAGRTGLGTDWTGGGPCDASPAWIGLEQVERVLDDSRATYCMLAENPLPGLPDTAAFVVNGCFASGRPSGAAQALYPAQRGLYGPPEKCQWWRDPADSPVRGEYGAYWVSFGTGEAIYFPFDLGRLYWLYHQSAHRQLIGHWVRRFLAASGSAAAFGLDNAPLCVHVTAHRVGDTRDVLVHLLNHSGCQATHFEMPVPISGVVLRGSGGPSRVTALRAGRELAVEPERGGWRAEVPTIGLFEAVLLEGMP